MCVCSIAAMTDCVCSLFGAAAASSSVQGWEEQRYLSLYKIHMPARGQGRDDRDHSKGCKIELSCTPAPHRPTPLLDPGGQHSTLTGAYHHKGQNA